MLAIFVMIQGVPMAYLGKVMKSQDIPKWLSGLNNYFSILEGGIPPTDLIGLINLNLFLPILLSILQRYEVGNKYFGWYKQPYYLYTFEKVLEVYLNPNRAGI